MPEVMVDENIVTTGIWRPSTPAISMRGMLLRSLIVIAILSSPLTAAPFKPPAAVPAPPAPHDGLHDLDYSVGAWREHTVRLAKPLTGSTTWFEMDAIAEVTQALGGRVNLIEYEGDGPRGHLSLVAVRIYDPKAQQWRLNFSTPERGALWPTPMVGQFRDGRGELYSEDEIDGRTVLVRFTVFSLGPNAHRAEQAFSVDGGKTWETNWIDTYTRITDAELARARAKLPRPEGSHDFDFDTSSKVHIKRLAGTTWVEYSGTHTIRKLWGGRADVVELSADGPAGHIAGLGLRLYNPATHEWNLNWLNGNAAYFGPPTIGRFANGRGEFYDTEEFGGRTVLLRNVWTEITPKSAHFEQAISPDGGKTWETNWISTMTR
jgi:hypothetical protein